MKLELKFLGSESGTIDLTPVEPYLKGLPQLIRAFFVGMFHPRVSAWMKLYALAGIVYFFSPLDIVPDFVTGVGFIDDAIFALLIMQAFLHRMPQAVLARILGTEDTDKSLVFFNVKEAANAFASFSGSLYSTISERFGDLIDKYGAAAQGGETAAPPEDEPAEDSPGTPEG
ncbi:MAG: hypothetical protein B1H03_07415 [Planctomycetales bacterium 4484_113]|nr:MAG: hypothetical protein B1H03_07415 [Planctomycetales bacterium 4484_113]